MGAGPLIAAAGILLLLSVGMHPSYFAELLPALLVFGLGLSLTVAPLTATVLADADESDAGIASAINNAVARVAGLVGVSSSASSPPARSSAIPSLPTTSRCERSTRSSGSALRSSPRGASRP